MTHSPDPEPTPTSEPHVPVDPWLDPILRDHLDTYVHDDGFAARVVAGLPIKRRRRVWQRPLLLGVGGLIGAAAAATSAIGGALATPPAAHLLKRISELAEQPALQTTLSIGHVSVLVVCIALVTGSILQGLRLAHRT